MGFKINRVMVVTIEQPIEFAKAIRRLPDSVNKCVCCERHVGRPPLKAPAVILIADESDASLLAVFSAMCQVCASTRPRIQVITTWLQGLMNFYGGLEIPDIYEPGHA
jgi:hypothetical protein